jgi:HEAT repeat protein
MGFFDIFKSKPKGTKGGASEAPKPVDKEVARWADNVSKRAQNYDRQEAIEALARIGTTEAAAVLLKRFTFQIEPSITDQDEKDSAFRAIVGVGPEALPAIREFCQKAESITWALRMMRAMLDDEAYVGEVLTLLARWDTEYDRNPDPKIQLITALEELKDARVRPAVERFLEDVHEPTRFHAVTTLFAQGEPEASEPVVRAFLREEAMRTKNRIADGLAAQSWPIPEPLRQQLDEALPRGFSVVDGIVVRG